MVKESRYLASEVAVLSPVIPFTTLQPWVSNYNHSEIRTLHYIGGNIILTLATRQVAVQIIKQCAYTWLWTVQCSNSKGRHS